MINSIAIFMLENGGAKQKKTTEQIGFKNDIMALNKLILPQKIKLALKNVISKYNQYTKEPIYYAIKDMMQNIGQYEENQQQTDKTIKELLHQNELLKIEVLSQNNKLAEQNKIQQQRYEEQKSQNELLKIEQAQQSQKIASLYDQINKMFSHANFSNNMEIDSHDVSSEATTCLGNNSNHNNIYDSNHIS